MPPTQNAIPALDENAIRRAASSRVSSLSSYSRFAVTAPIGNPPTEPRMNAHTPAGDMPNSQTNGRQNSRPMKSAIRVDVIIPVSAMNRNSDGISRVAQISSERAAALAASAGEPISTAKNIIAPDRTANATTPEKTAPIPSLCPWMDFWQALIIITSLCTYYRTYSFIAAIFARYNNAIQQSRDTAP